MSEDLLLEVETAPGFDSRSVLDTFAESVEQPSEHGWQVSVASPLHGLAIARATSPEEIVSISEHRLVDADGWMDWTRVAPEEWEMTSALRPAKATGPGLDAAYRYERAWVWDTSALAADPALLIDLGLAEIGGRRRRQYRPRQLDLERDQADLHVAGHLGDPRVRAAIWLTRQGCRSSSSRASPNVLAWSGRSMNAESSSTSARSAGRGSRPDLSLHDARHVSTTTPSMR
jgi:hypothetical protein